MASNDKSSLWLVYGCYPPYTTVLFKTRNGDFELMTYVFFSILILIDCLSN